MKFMKKVAKILMLLLIVCGVAKAEALDKIIKEGKGNTSKMIARKILVSTFMVFFLVLGMFGCRNIKDEQTNSTNQVNSELPKKEEPEKSYEGTIETAKLFEEFTKNEKEARKKYIGKTFLVTGTISEVFILNSLKYMMDSKTRDKAAGIMLFPETKESQKKLVKSGESVSNFPVTRLYDLLEGLDKSALAPSDFSYRSEYGGVYCSFSKAFDYEGKKKVSLICQISDYKKSGTEQIFARTSREPRDPYATKDDEMANYEKNYGKKSFKTENRVILTGCREVAPSEINFVG